MEHIHIIIIDHIRNLSGDIKLEDFLRQKVYSFHRVAISQTFSIFFFMTKRARSPKLFLSHAYIVIKKNSSTFAFVICLL